jgi:hypothetical protein
VQQTFVGSAVHPERVYFCTVNHNFDTELFITEGEARLVMRDSGTASCNENMEKRKCR